VLESPFARFQLIFTVVSFCQRQKSCSKLQSTGSVEDHEYVDSGLDVVFVVVVTVVVDKLGLALLGKMLQFDDAKNFKSSKAMSPMPDPLVASKTIV
jgi:hypothetical protein